jgi:hypothetical protein
MRTHMLAAGSLCSLSHRERGGVRGFALSMGFEPPHPNPLPKGERERTEFAACLLSFPRKREPMITGHWNMGPRLRGDDPRKRSASTETQLNSITS